MHFAGTYRCHGRVDVTALDAALRQVDEETWQASRTRQTIYKAHARTQTLRLVYDEDMRHEAPTVHPLFDRFEDALAPAMHRIRAAFASTPAPGNAAPQTGYFVRIVIVRLAADAEVLSHTDAGHSLARAHRIHLPIVTHEGALFAVAGDVRHLPAGELWEINNRRPHAVRNAGPERIHAILDYVVPGEIVDDPQGPLIA